MDQTSTTRTASNLAPIAAIVGGFLALAGVLVGWFGAAGHTFKGTEDWTGAGALATGVVMVLGGLAAMDMFVREPGTRRIGGLAATAAGIITIFLVALAFVRADGVIAGGGASFGLYVSAIGAVFGAAGGWLSMQAAGPSPS